MWLGSAVIHVPTLAPISAPAVALSGEETTVLPADDGQASTLIGGDLPLPLAPPRRRLLPFRFLLVVAGVVLLGLVLLLALSGSSSENPSSTTPSTTAATVSPTTTPTVPPTAAPPAARTRDTPAPSRHHRGGKKN